MDSKYRYVFFKYLHNYIGLNVLEKKLKDEKIKAISFEDYDYSISEFFTLLNQGDDAFFTDNEKQEYANIFVQDINTLLSSEWYSKALEFIKRTYQKFFHLDEEVEYVYYGPMSDDFLAPSNCIVIGLNYDKYNLDVEDEKYDDEINRQDIVVTKILNYIQFELSKQYNIRLAALAYNEVTLSQPFVKI